MMRAPRALAVGVLATLSLAACDGLGSVPVGPVAAPQVVCQGVPRVPCEQAAGSIGVEMGRVIRVVVRCTLPVCTVAEGDAEVTTMFADGRQELGGYGWTTAPEVRPQPARPMDPVCLGVPLETCLEMATDGPEGYGVDAAVRGITVRCSGVCTATSGEGQTTYEFHGRRPSVTIDWEYGNGG